MFVLLSLLEAYLLINLMLFQYRFNKQLLKDSYLTFAERAIKNYDGNIRIQKTLQQWVVRADCRAKRMLRVAVTSHLARMDARGLGQQQLNKSASYHGAKVGLWQSESSFGCFCENLCSENLAFICVVGSYSALLSRLFPQPRLGRRQLLQPAVTWDLLKWQEARHFDLRVSLFLWVVLFLLHLSKRLVIWGPLTSRSLCQRYWLKHLALLLDLGAEVLPLRFRGSLL